MEILREVLLSLHLIGMAIIVGGYFAVIRSPRVMPGMLHAAYLQLVTGLLLVGLAEMSGQDVDHVKVGLKLVVAILVTVCAFAGLRQQSAARASAGGRDLGVGSETSGDSATPASALGSAGAPTMTITASPRVSTTGAVRRAQPSATMAHLTFGLAVLNVLIAVFLP